MCSEGRHLSHNYELFFYPSKFRSPVSGLQYLTFTRPDIAYSVNHVCQFMQFPTVARFQLAKRLLRYVQGTTHFGMKILAESTLDLYGFSNADWVGCPTTRISTTGFCTFLGSNCISWSAKKQAIMARSSVEVEYKSMASTATEITWLSFLLCDLGIPQPQVPILHCDNPNASYMSVNPILHARTILHWIITILENVWHLEHCLLNLFHLQISLLIYLPSLC